MCTVSWIHSGEGFELFCNRDEKRTRSRAVEPQIAKRRGVRYIAPIDADFGGTWLAANELGIAVGLLNGPGEKRGQASRGFLVAAVADTGSAEDACGRLAAMDLSPYSPFTVVALGPCGKSAVADWDGVELKSASDASSRMPLTSSSFDPAEVSAARQAEFIHRASSAGRLDSGVLHAFHSSHGVRRSAYSTCMHRDDAHTVSFSRVMVTAAQVTFSYTPSSPCESAPPILRALERRA
jgi:hypothetical protein